VSVANNIVRDERRTTQRRRRLLVGWISHDDHVPHTPAADTTLLAEERRAGVRRALETLRPRDRRLLLLRHEGFSYREIAEALGMSPASVGTLLVRATAAFSKAYRELDDASD
jgi:RNA polymerase sigma factor (sigma-70 family)